MSDVSFPADVDECDAQVLADKCIALLAGIRAWWIQPARPSQMFPSSGL
jgi:hypothetical protein